MAESEDRKTEEPTPRRLEKAREEGQVAKSKDVSNFFVLGSVLLILWLARNYLIEQLNELGHLALRAPSSVAESTEAVASMEALDAFGRLIARICAPVIGVAVMVAVLVNMVQTQGLFAAKALTPKFERLNPVQGLKDRFSRKSLVELLKSLVKMIVLGATLYNVILGLLPSLVRMPYSSLTNVAFSLAAGLARLFMIALVVFGGIAVFDYWFQRFDYLRRQRMTPDEVKRERRDDEGDPQMRAQRRSIAQESMQDSLLERTASATLVVKGTGRSMAIALIVDPEAKFTPWLVNKGVENGAAAILNVADRKEIRVVSDTRLAQQLYGEVAIDADLPPKLAARATALLNS